MFKWLKNRAETRHRAKILYKLVANHARNPVFFQDLFVTDSMTARYEILCLHLYLLLERLKKAGNSDELSQNLTEVFVKELDRAYRDIGTRDLAVPKQIKKLIGGFYERCNAYQTAIKTRDENLLLPLLKTYIYANMDIELAAMKQLAAYIFETQHQLATTPLEKIKSAKFRFPTPEIFVTTKISGRQNE